MTTNWMQALSLQYERACEKFRGERLMLLCDIDGTIIDMRNMIREMLWSYDRAHASSYFQRLQLADITVHENEVEQLLEGLNVPAETQAEIMSWYLERRWMSEALHEMHRPFQGVLDVIRWFQLQPNTRVGLVTGRPEMLREDTLRSLNLLGKPHRVSFTDDLLYMNPGNWEESVGEVKAAGLRHFEKAGYRVFAFIDNEPANLKALATANIDNKVLLLHANTIFESKRTRLPRGTVRGKDYRLSELIRDEKALPRHVQLAWHGVNDAANLRQFLASDVHWAEVDARVEPASHEVIVRHDSLPETPLASDERYLSLDKVLDKITEHSRAIKIDLKAGSPLLEQVLELVAQKGLNDEDLWFNANIERLMEQGFRQLVATYPDAIIQCPIDFLAPLILAAPHKALETVKMLTDWGINRFSISWKRPNLHQLFDQMDQWGCQVNIYNVPDLETFLEAVLLLPRSVTSDFNFPMWQYYGQGSGQSGDHYTYKMRKRNTHDQS